MSALDAAIHAANAAPDDLDARVAVMARMSEAEMFLLLDAAGVGETVTPQIFDTDDGRFALVFETEDRLADFAGAAPYVALSGRALAAMLTGQGIGMALGLDRPDGAFLLPGDGVDWLARMTADVLEEVSRKIEGIAPPAGLPERLLTALDAGFATTQGRADAAWLAAVTYEGGGSGHLLAFTDAAPGAEGALASAVREALVFSGLEAGVLDVTFLRSSDAMAARLVRQALRIDLPKAQMERMAADGPPKLR